MITVDSPFFKAKKDLVWAFDDGCGIEIVDSALTAEEK